MGISSLKESRGTPSRAPRTPSKGSLRPSPFSRMHVSPFLRWTNSRPTLCSFITHHRSIRFIFCVVVICLLLPLFCLIRFRVPRTFLRSCGRSSFTFRFEGRSLLSFMLFVRSFRCVRITICNLFSLYLIAPQENTQIPVNRQHYLLLKLGQSQGSFK